MHFLYPGRMAVDDIAHEMKRAETFLHGNGVRSVYSVRLRLSLLNQKNFDLFFLDRIGDDLELLEVPPLAWCRGSDGSGDIFASQRLRQREGLVMALSLRDHSSAMRGVTGPDRGPAAVGSK
jgi:hypothetical protein